jgi:DNA-binding XRE family transcriptional regulator
MPTKKAVAKATRKPARKPSKAQRQKSIYREENVAVLAALREVRERAQLTQGQLALRLGRSQNYVTGIERAATRADGVQVYDWCMACGTTLSAWAKLVEKALKERGFPVVTTSSP